MSATSLAGRAVGVAILVCGAHYLVRSLTGKTPLEHARARFGKSVVREIASPPSDPVDEASWESFPASDPPAISHPNS